MTAVAESPLTAGERLRGAVARLLGRMPEGVQRWLTREPPIVVEGQTLDPMLQLIRRVRIARGMPGYCEPDVTTARARHRRETRIHAGRPTRVAGVQDLTIPGPDGPIGARLYLPHDAGTEGPLLVYLHGGGFVICDVDMYDEPCRRLCRGARTRVLSVDYRLAPEHPFPAGLHDAAAALRWAQDNAAALGARVDRISVGGDSAGGTLAAVVSLEAAIAGRAPMAQLLIYPATDAVTSRPSQALYGDGYFLDERDRDDFARHYQGTSGVSRDDPRVSPLFAEHLAPAPPALVFTAGFDILRDEGEAYAAALAAAGVEAEVERFPSLGHSFVNLISVSRASARALDHIALRWRTLLNELETAERTRAR